MSLLPCPFCGSTKVSQPADTNGLPDAAFVLCLDCGAFGPDDRLGPDPAAAWNRRAHLIITGLQPGAAPTTPNPETVSTVSQPQH